jgi:hypothetical protein|tara:strand:+ start:330 stop:662 length:333 start_codon:yes stop_codon:yes gene_type:complete
MADTLKVLGQAAPSDTNEATLYTVPENTVTTVSSIVACNLTGNTPTFRIAVRPEGATVANENYIYYDKAMTANNSVFTIIGITLSDNDVVSVRSSAADEIAFSIFGVETS